MSARRLYVGATFTASPLDPLLRAQGFDGVAFTRYNQLLQALLAPDPQYADDATLLLVRLADFVRHEANDRAQAPDALAALLAQRADAWLDALASFAAGRATPPRIVVLPSPSLDARGDALAEACRRLERALLDLPGLRTLEWADFVASSAIAQPFDPVADKLGHVPLTIDGFAAFARWLARRLRSDAGAVGTPTSAHDAPSLARFFERLQLRIASVPLDDEAALAKSARLSHTAATFHLSGHPYLEGDLLDATSRDACGLALTVVDRFGQYGCSGFALVRTDAGLPVLADFVLSCTVLGKQVEHGVLLALAHAAQRAALPAVALDTIHTDGNQPAVDFIDAIAAQARVAIDRSGPCARLRIAPTALADAVLACAKAPQALAATAQALDLAPLFSRSTAHLATHR
ncbi:fkbH domain protein [Burkholderia stabilis]|uniref:FkbH domain protein n=1 Tax=Burkholderia stabilis TaxID=95485 RepID=A0A4Q2A5L0_9BURK|nr:fkbH domain protein [Burkholderia stabilis]RXV64358.1 fkbH domain protein [Burkholderia stabilis]